MNLHEVILLSLIQGVLEWLPVSSKSMLFLYSVFISRYSLHQSYVIALALQGSSVLSVVLYFWRDIVEILFLKNKKLFMFIVLTTFFTGVLGIPLYILFTKFLKFSDVHVGLVTIFIGVLLIIQAIVLSKIKSGMKRIEDLSFLHAIAIGLAQGLAVMPGLSRSGVTLATALYIGYRIEDAFKLSFLASIPANLGASLLVYMSNDLQVDLLQLQTFILAIIIIFLVSFLFIDITLRLARRYSYKLTFFLGILTTLIGGLVVLLQTL